MLVAIFLMLFSVVAAENKSKDVEIKLDISTALNTSENYTTPFMLTNNDDEIGVDDDLDIFFSMNLTGEPIFRYNKTVNINYYTRSGLGHLYSDNESNETLCVRAEPLNFYDYNLSNNNFCINITFSNQINNSEENNNTENTTINETIPPEINSTNETDVCDCKLDIVTDKQIYSEGDSVSFRMVICESLYQTGSYLENIEYWIENVHGDIEKSKLNTTNPSEKSFTPKIDSEEKAFVIKSRIRTCNATKKLVAFRKDVAYKESFLEMEVPESAKAGKPFIIKIDGYKGNTGKTLLSSYLTNGKTKVSEITKNYVNSKNTEFQFRSPIIPDPDIKSDTYSLIIEGLDLEAEEKIRITSDEEKETLICEETSPEIKSFYTRKQKFSDNITVYANTETTGKIKIISSAQQKNISAKEASEGVEIKINYPDEILVAELEEDGKSVTKYIKLELEKEEKEVVENERSEQKELEKDNEKTENKTENKITGGATIEKNADIKTTITYILLGSIGLSILFRQEIQKLLKKTKLIKKT